VRFGGLETEWDGVDGWTRGWSVGLSVAGVIWGCRDVRERGLDDSFEVQI
jgi:hypothetical protein